MLTAFFPSDRQNQMKRDWLVWLVLWLLALAISQLTDIDRSLEGLFFDPFVQQFPLRNDPLWAGYMHDGIKYLSVLAWVAMLFVAIRAQWQHDTARYESMVFVLVVSAIAVLINGVFKGLSAHSCPWSLSEFGGQADYFRLLASVPANPGPGGCLPSGHASVAFMWWPLVYACVRWRSEWLWPVAAMVTVFGVFCGYVQMARGAHFMTHILISAAVCGGVTSLAYHLPDIKDLLRGLVADIKKERPQEVSS